MRDQYNPGPKEGESIGVNFLDQGIPGLLFVAEKMGALLLAKPDEVDIGWVISRSLDAFGEKTARRSLGMGMREFWKQHPDQATRVPMLRSLYEKGPCSFYRERPVSWLIDLDALTKDLRAECTYDANSDIRDLVASGNSFRTKVFFVPRRPSTIEMHMVPPAIEIRDLRKVYGDKAAVDGLTLSVPQGCFFGFLGPNGAGKTTTIKMLMGLAPPTSGSIELLGMPMPGRSLEIKQQIGLVPDESMLFDHLTGGEFIEFVGRIYGLDRPTARARADELLDLFELGYLPKKLIAEYSKGMRKRVAMAAALIHRPKLFLMDEPFEGVDAVGARLMKDILLDQVRHGATIFLTSHVLEVVERLCERVGIIHAGKLIAEGPMSEMRGAAETLEDAFVRALGMEHAAETLDWL